MAAKYSVPPIPQSGDLVAAVNDRFRRIGGHLTAIAAATNTSSSASSSSSSSSSGSTSAVTPLNITFTGSSATEGIPYSGAFHATGGTGADTFSILTGDPPDGITLDPTTGQLAGTPTTPGSFTFRVAVTDSGSPAQTASREVTITVTQEVLGTFKIGTPTYNYDDLTASAVVVYVPVTPPSPLGDVVGGHIFVNFPDQQSNTTNLLGQVIGEGTLGGKIAWEDMGKFPYVAGQQWWQFKFVFPIGPKTGNMRIAIAPYSQKLDPGVDSTTPSVVLTINPFSGPKPAAAVNVTPFLVTSVTPLNDANYTGGVSFNQTVGGKLRTPIAIQVSLSGLPSPLPDNWDYQLVGYVNGDTTTAPVLASGYFNQPIPFPNTNPPDYSAGPDGITLYHTFGPETPASGPIAVTIYAVSGLFIAPTRNVGGTRVAVGPPQWYANNIVPGVTPSCVVTYGGNGQVIDFSAAILATLNSTTTVLNGLFGVAPLGISQPFLDNLAVATANIIDAAVQTTKIADANVTNVKLSILSVANSNIQNLAVGTAQIQAAAITTAKIANLAVTTALINTAAVGTAQIQNAAITNALIGNLAVDTAQINTAAVTQAKIANLAVGTAQIAALAVTDAKINDLSASKITAGTISASISISAPTITGGSISSATFSSGSISGSTLTLSATSGTTKTIDLNPGASFSQPIRVSNSANSNVGVVDTDQVYAGNLLGTSVRITPNGVSGAGLYVNGQIVVTARYTGALVTLADVIACINYHGLH